MKHSRYARKATHFLSPVELKRAVISGETGAITATLEPKSFPVSKDESF